MKADFPRRDGRIEWIWIKMSFAVAKRILTTWCNVGILVYRRSLLYLSVSVGANTRYPFELYILESSFFKIWIVQWCVREVLWTNENGTIHFKVARTCFLEDDKWRSYARWFVWYTDRSTRTKGWYSANIATDASPLYCFVVCSCLLPVWR